MKPESNEENWQENEEISKTQLKKNADELKQFVENLITLNESQLKNLPISESFLNQIFLAKKVKMGAKKRQIQFISKFLRADEALLNSIQNTLELTQNHHPKQILQKRKWENQSKMLLDGNDEMISQFLAENENADRQKIRTFTRNYQKSNNEQKKLMIEKQLFDYIKSLDEFC